MGVITMCVSNEIVILPLGDGHALDFTLSHIKFHFPSIFRGKISNYRSDTFGTNAFGDPRLRGTFQLPKGETEEGKSK